MVKKLCVLGMGHIGLPTALVFADAGVEAVGVDTNARIVADLNRGEVQLEEAGLESLYRSVRARHSFRAGLAPEPADAFIVAVPTPVHPDRSADLRFVVAAIRSIVPVLRPGNLIIVESTVPPRTTEDVVAPLLQQAGFTIGDDLFLAYCPERVMPGNMLRELVANSRIVGGYDPASAARAADWYRIVVKGEIVETTAVTAEMTKLMENTYRDVNIALANELAIVAAAIGVDALEAIRCANKHPRVNLHSPGPGVGGHCIAVDPYFIVQQAPFLTPLIATARHVNNGMPEFVVAQVLKLAGDRARRSLSPGPVAVFGLTYKGNVGDIRESPALEIVRLLEEEGFAVKAHDPHVKPADAPFPLYGASEALRGAWCLLVLADHCEFAGLAAAALDGMTDKCIIDTKHCLRIAPEDGVRLYHYGNLFELRQFEESVWVEPQVAAAEEDEGETNA
ncbi:MAG: nucleotide sugar dehydrogenase [Paenibacillaceae bacterium]|nr:nucleotide sugar dehydrogenase [Paenibacillaceae bacterium]